MINRIFLFALLFLCQILAAQKNEVSIKIIEATSQEWVSGVPGGRSGTNYIIKVYFVGTKVQFTNLWIGKKNVPFEEEFFSQTKHVAESGDSILLTYNHINGLNDKTTDSKSRPLHFNNGAALVGYLIDGKTRYLTVKKIKKNQPLLGK